MSVTEAFLDERDIFAQREAALERLYGRINYERTATIPYQSGGLKLDRMRELLRRLGDPQQGLKIVHVAGTKGKGSTAFPKKETPLALSLFTTWRTNARKESIPFPYRSCTTHRHWFSVEKTVLG